MLVEWHRSARRAFSNALANARDGRDALALCTAEVESEEDRAILLDRGRALANHAEAGQVLVGLATQELLRRDLPAEVEFDDLGTLSLGVPPRKERVFAVLAPGLYERKVPAPLSTFEVAACWGREGVIDELREALDLSRLVTVTGTAGVGKSTIVRRLESEIGSAFPGGSYWVDLHQVARETLLMPALAAALEVTRVPDPTLYDAIAAQLHRGEALLVLDGVDWVRQSVTTLVSRLLSECPNLQIVVTGARRLGLTYEQVLPVVGLDVPLVGTPHLAFCDYPAIGLFVDRAGIANPGFEIDERNAEDVAGICRLLQGHPLAIIMAAAKMGTLSSRQVFGRLRDDPLSLIRSAEASTDGTMLRSLGTAVRLSSGTAQTLLRRLSVFAGTFDLDLAKKVVGFDGGLPPEEVPRALEELVESHIVTRQGGGTRYAFHLAPIVRAYGWEACRQARETSALQRAHRDGLGERLDEIGKGLQSGSEEAVEDLEILYEDARAFWSEGLRFRSQAGAAVTSIVACNSFWFKRGLSQEGLTIASEAIRAAHANRSPDYLRLFNLAGNLAIRLGNFREARHFALEGFRVALAEEKRLDQARALNTLASVAFEVGRVRTASRLLAQSASILREEGATQILWIILASYVAVLATLGRLEQAERALEEAQGLLGPGADGWPLATLRMNEAALALAGHDFPRGWAALEMALDQTPNGYDPEMLARMLVTAASLALQQGDRDTARSLVTACETLVQTSYLASGPRWGALRQRIWDALGEAPRLSFLSDLAPEAVLRQAIGSQKESVFSTY